MNTNCCSDGACIWRDEICAPQGDDVNVLVSIYDTDQDEFDISGALEAVFVVSDSITGADRIVKKMTEGDISVSTNRYQLVVRLTSEDTIKPVKRKNYYELRITSADGRKRTVSAGLYKAEQTIIKDVV